MMFTASAYTTANRCLLGRCVPGVQINLGHPGAAVMTASWVTGCV